MTPTVAELYQAVTFLRDPLALFGGSDRFEVEGDLPEGEHERFIVRICFDDDGDAARFARWANDDRDDGDRVGDGYNLFWPKGTSAQGPEARVYCKAVHLDHVIEELIEKWEHVERFDGALVLTGENEE